MAGVVQRETVLRRALARLAAYDVVIVDTSPAMGLLTYNALLYATELGRCSRCDSPLTDEESRATGMGPVCRGY